MEIELRTITTNGNDGAAHLSHEGETAGNGDSASCSVPSETDRLLSVQVHQAAGCNGERPPAGPAAHGQRNLENGNASSLKNNNLHRIKRELNELVFWRLRLWMVILFLFLLIFAVIMISLVMCSAIYQDEDDEFDSSLFKVPLHFNGSFELPNLVFTEELIRPSSNETQTLAADLQLKLADLYRSSPALGRYFSEAVIHAVRNGSVVADYQLTFLLPEEQQDQLRNFTLSREVVYNVFRQFLYDRESQESAPDYIDPLSLHMFLNH